jgi:hypothetical protein
LTEEHRHEGESPQGDSAFPFVFVQFAFHICSPFPEQKIAEMTNLRKSI